MISNSIKIHSILLSLTVVTSFFAEPVAANESDSKMIIHSEVDKYGAPKLTINKCEKKICKEILTTKEIENTIANGYSEISTKDINADNIDEIILTAPQEGSVNTCSKIYAYDKKQNTFINMLNDGGDICNISTQENSLISTYRSGAKWHNDIYSIEGINLKLKISDSCVGCGEIIRTTYSENGTDSFIVTDDTDYNQRRKITSLITSNKAFLHGSPDSKNATRSYLIRNDKVELLDSSYIDDAAWYKVRYISKNGKIFKAWLKCSDLSYCSE